MDEFVIQTENLTKSYSSWFRKAARPALNRLTISIPRGCIFGFLGPNGAGKTTTIKILMGLIRPTGGTAVVLGKPYDDVESKNRIGFLPDSPAFTPSLSAVEFLDVCARLLKIPSAQRKQRVEEVLEIVRMTPHAKSKIGTFSRGMLQRVGIAQAILNKGHLLCAGPLSTLLSGGGDGVTVDVRSEDALRELVIYADQVRRLGQGEWELLFKQNDPAVMKVIEEQTRRFAGLVEIRRASEDLESFFFKKIEEDSAKRN